MSSRRRRLPLFAALAASALALGACSSPAPAPEGDPQEAPLAATTAHPITVENCGTSVTFDAAPERVLAIKSTSIEMLLALGLEERIIGTAFSDGPVAEEWSAAAQGLASVSDSVPGQEATLSLEPDLVYAGWESNVTADGAGDRDALAALGVNTYVSPSACQSEGHQPNPLTFDHVFSDIAEIGSVFGVSERAEALIAAQRDRLAALPVDDRNLTALWFSSGSDTPFVGAGIGAPQMMMDAAGLTNIAGDIDDTWSSMSWEAVVDANPDVIILIDSAWGSTEKKIGVLESHPAVAQLSAVQEGRYLVLPFPTAEAGVRNVEAVESLVTQLQALELP